MADVSPTVYLSRKLSRINEDSSKHMYDGLFSAPAPTSRAARIDDYREIFPPEKASLGSSIPILDLPPVDRSVGSARAVDSGFDYAGVFGGFGDNDGFEVPSEKSFGDSKRTAKRDAKLPRIPTMRMPSKSQEFSCNYGNDQTTRHVQSRRIPSKSQEFSSTYENDQASISAQTRRMSSTSQEFVCNYGKDETSSPIQTKRMPSKSKEFPINHGKDQTSSPVQTRRVPSKSQEFPSSYGNDQTSNPVQPRRIPAKSQEFSCNNENDQTLSPTQTGRQPSKSQEFSCNFSNNQMSTSPVQSRKPISSTSPNDQTTASPLPQQAVDSVQHVSVSYHKSNQFNKDSTNGTKHIAHLHAVPGYTLLFDEAGPVRKPAFDKAKRLSMNDADFSVAVDKASRQGKHTRTVSDLGTNQLTSDNDSQTRSVSVSNSPQSFGSSGYFKRSTSQRPKSSKKKREKNPFLDGELNMNSAAAISAAAVKRAIEEAEEQMRWAKQFLRELESNGFIKPTLKDSFKVKVTCVADTYGPKRSGSLKVKATRQKKCFNDETAAKRHGNLNSRASNEIKPKVDPEITSQNQLETEASGLKRILNVVSAGVGSTVRITAPDTIEESIADAELKLPDKSDKHDGGGEWEAAKHLTQLFTGVKNRFVNFMSKQADTEKTVLQKDASSNYESLEQTVESTHEMLNVDTNQVGEANLEHTEEKVGTSYTSSSVVGESEHDSIKTSVDLGDSVVNEIEVNRSGSASTPDNEMFTSKQCGASESLDELKSRTSGLNALQEVQEQNQEILDESVKIERESETWAMEQGVREIPEQACQSEAYNDKVRNREGDAEILNEMPGLESAEKKVDETLNNVVVTSGRIEEGCNIKEMEMPKDTHFMQEDVRMVEECCERGIGAGQDVTSEATEHLIEVVDDVSEHDVLLAENGDTSERDDLFLRKIEPSVPDKIKQYEPGVKFLSEEKGKMTESAATVSFEPKKDEQPHSVQRANELIGEGVCEQTPGCSEVSDDESDHDEYLPAVEKGAGAGQDVSSEDLIEVVDDVSEHDTRLAEDDDTCVQADSFLSKNEEPSVPDKIEQYEPGVELLSKETGRMTESEATVSFEPKEDVNVEQPQPVQRANELIGEGVSEQTPCFSEVSDDESDHDEYLPAVDDVLLQDEFLSSSRNKEASLHEIVSEPDLPSEKGSLKEFTSSTFEPDVNFEKFKSVETADGLNGEYISEYSGSHSKAADELVEHVNRISEASKERVVAFEEERIATGGRVNSEFETKEQPSSANAFIIEEMTDTSMTAEDGLDLDSTEKDIDKAHEASPFTDAKITERATVLKFEQKHSDEEASNLPSETGPENQDDESDVITREANDESSHKRRRWFENRNLPGIFQGANERSLDNVAEGLTAEDRVEVCADKIVNDSGEGVSLEHSDSCTDKGQEGEDLHTTEGSHRRRRWFENSSEKVDLNSIPVNESAEELKQNICSDDKLVNERNDCADVMESNNIARDKEESRANTEAGHRRRRWFESGVESGTTKQEELHKTSTSEELADTHQSEVQSKEREKEKERLAVERAIREARQRAFVEARDRAAAEARLKAAAAQDRLGKASSEAKPTLTEKASMDAKLKAERAAVERATYEARERAMLKAMSEKGTLKTRVVDPKNQNSGPSSSSGYSTSVPCTSERPSGATTESPQRRKAISERNKRTMERAAKALEEKNMRDVLVLNEQAERTRLSGLLDAEVKRWSSGKEGNLRSLLSTLQYVLGPDSGWQPIPLTDLVTTTAVRKAYKRAALCVHPDKLQQRRATVQHKYICEKVFDLLKDAWQKFNPENR